VDFYQAADEENREILHKLPLSFSERTAISGGIYKNY
jgi:hypothetical protein